jgi:hypothetical protein
MSRFIPRPDPRFSQKPEPGNLKLPGFNQDGIKIKIDEAEPKGQQETWYLWQTVDPVWVGKPRLNSWSISDNFKLVAQITASSCGLAWNLICESNNESVVWFDNSLSHRGANFGDVLTYQTPNGPAYMRVRTGFQKVQG